MKSLDDILYGKSMQSEGDMDAYREYLLRALGPQQLDFHRGAATEAAIRSGYSPTARPPSGSGGILYRTLKGNL